MKKMIQTTVTFDRTLSVRVYAPEGTTPEQLREVAARIADDGLDGWDPDPWVAFVGYCETVEVADKELALGPPNQYNFRSVVDGSRLKGESTLVLSDDREDIVCPEDARWWLASREDA
jgi:hypothetical protein